MSELETVLIVDDDDDIRTIGTISLGTVGGMSVRQASSGPEGASMAREEGPDVILLDMMMPGLDGLGTLAELRADPRTAEIPVIFMTAKAQSRDLPQYLAAGAIGVIAKPFDPMTLAEEVRALVAAAASDADVA